MSEVVDCFSFEFQGNFKINEYLLVCLTLFAQGKFRIRNWNLEIIEFTALKCFNDTPKMANH